MNFHNLEKFNKLARTMRFKIDELADNVLSGDYSLKGIVKNASDSSSLSDVTFHLINEIYKNANVTLTTEYLNIKDDELSLTHFSSIVCSQLFIGINTNAILNVSYILVRRCVGVDETADFILPECLDMREIFIKCSKKNGSYDEIIRVLIAILYFRAFISMNKKEADKNETPFIKFTEIKNNISIDEMEYIGYTYDRLNQFNAILMPIIKDSTKNIKKIMRNLNMKNERDLIQRFDSFILLLLKAFGSSFNMEDGYCKLTYLYAKFSEYNFIYTLTRDELKYSEDCKDIFDTYNINNTFSNAELRELTVLAIYLFSDVKSFASIAYTKYCSTKDDYTKKLMMDILHHLANGNKNKFSFIKKPMFNIINSLNDIRQNTARIEKALKGETVSFDVKIGDTTIPFQTFGRSIEDTKDRLNNIIKLSTYFGISFIRKIVGSVGSKAQKLNNYMSSHVINEVFNDIDLVVEEIKNNK